MSEPNNAVIKYLPQFGQGLMAVGYVMDHFGCYEAPLPSAFILLGHLFVLSDPNTLSLEKPKVRVINIIFLFGNIFSFVYDVVTTFPCFD